MQSNSKVLGMSSLVLLSIVAIFNLRTLPIMAEYGSQLIAYYIIAALFFFVPSALICAELATAWPKQGGIYVWIKHAFGHRPAFLAIWLEWINNVVSWPATLVFIAATLAYVVSPSLSHNKLYTIVIMLSLFWGFTIINLLGVKLSARISSIGLIFGTLVPTLLIIILGLSWYASKHVSQIHLTTQSMVPSLHFTTAAFLITVMLGFSGMQITAFHANSVINPQKNFPKGIFIAAIVIVLFSVLGSLSIAIIIPHHSINLISGNIQSLSIFLKDFHLSFLTPVLATAIAIGAAAMLNTWIGGPSKGLLTAAENGDLPKFFALKNKRNAPVSVLITQAIIVTIFSCLFLFLPSMIATYWLITALSGIMTLLMYIILFSSAIRLRYTHAHVERAYKIPGGNVGMWIVAGMGITMCILGICLGFIPLKTLHHISAEFYDSFLLIALCILITPVFLIKNKIGAPS